MIKDWDQINAPWIENEDYSRALLDLCSFSDILDHWNIEYTSCSSGEYDHKMRCPLPIHAGGQERTASCYFSDTKNKFRCYGCSNSGSIIDFISLYSGRPFYEAVKWLSDFARLTPEQIEAGLSNLPAREHKDPDKTVSKYVLRSGILIRDFLKSIRKKADYSKWVEWADRRFERLDRYSAKLTDKDWEQVKAYYEKIERFLRERK